MYVMILLPIKDPKREGYLAELVRADKELREPLKNTIYVGGIFEGYKIKSVDMNEWQTKEETCVVLERPGHRYNNHEEIIQEFHSWRLCGMNGEFYNGYGKAFT